MEVLAAVAVVEIHLLLALVEMVIPHQPLHLKETMVALELVGEVDRAVVAAVL